MGVIFAALEAGTASHEQDGRLAQRKPLALGKPSNGLLHRTVKASKRDLSHLTIVTDSLCESSLDPYFERPREVVKAANSAEIGSVRWQTAGRSGKIEGGGNYFRKNFTECGKRG